MAFSQLATIIRDLRKDMKELVTTLKTVNELRKDMKELVTILKTLNNHLGDLKNATNSIDRLQKTIEANEDNITKLIAEMSETNENIKGVLDIVKAVKEE